jgi:ankyrin repeat protein
MNHSLNNLDECIFDYLVLNADKPTALPKIFNDIRSGSGHRCDGLTDKYNHRQYFLSTCYSLDKNYKNIKKLYRDNKMYLLFQKDRHDANFESSFYNDHSLYDNSYWKDDYNLKNIINYMCENCMLYDFDNTYLSNLFDNTDTLLHLLVRYDKYDDLENLLKFHNVDMIINKKNVKGETPLDLAMGLKNQKMVKLLISYWNDDPNKKLSSEKQDYEQNRKTFVAAKSSRTNSETTYSKYWRYLSTSVYFVGLWYVFSNLFLFYNYITA